MAATAGPIKNVIVMIADGAGFNTLQATRLYLQGLMEGDARAGAAGRVLIADGPSFSATAQSVHPLDTRTTPLPGEAGLRQDPNVVYDPAKNYDFRPVAGTDPNGQPRGFAGYEWNRATYPDSGNTASTIATGEKTYNNAIDVDGNGVELFSIAELAKRLGKATGVVTTVQFSDATPSATGGAHNISRANANQIALEMFGAGTLDVIAGTGNPDFDDNGQARATPNYQWIGADLWNGLKADTYRSQDGNSWQLLQDRAAIQAAATGTPTTERLAMISKAFTSSNFNRAGAAAPNTTEIPFSVPRLESSATLSELSLAALNKLNADPDGMYLMIEGGAVDRAMHANNRGRMIEEYIDFNNAVKTVVDYINSPTSRATFEDTLLIVTADHDHLFFGPEGATIPYQPVQPDRNGDGVPEGLFFSTNHSNQIIPLLAAGAGSRQLLQLADHVDAATDAQGQRVGSGRAFTDQADLGNYLLAQMRLGATAVTEGADNIIGTEAGDVLDGLGGNDIIDGRGGNDTLTGGAGNDTLAGGAGDDTLFGGIGNDILLGGDGNDTLVGGPGNDVITGGAGTDRAVFSFALGAATVSTSATGALVITGPDGTDTLRGVEQFQFNDRLIDNADGTPLVDDLFYLIRNPDVARSGIDADLHYAQFGAREGRDPNGFFSTSGYLAANPDVARAGLDPLRHYEQTGFREGRDPGANFDNELYLARNPDVRAAGANPLAHFLQFGQGEGRTTSEAIGRASDIGAARGFDAQFYLLSNADVARAATGADGNAFDFALSHFNQSGWREGRDPNAVFDTRGYLSAYRDVAGANVNPLQHYVQFGAREGRDPSTDFDSSSYLGANRDVAAAGINPMEHYLQFGIYEGRSAFADGTFGFGTLG